MSRRPGPRPPARQVADGLTSPTVVRLVEIASSRGPTRDRLVEGFLRSRHAQFRAIAWRLRNRPRLVWSRDGDDLFALVAGEASEMLRDLDEKRAAEWDGWDDELYVRSASAIRAWAESGEVTGVAGMTGVMRRARSLQAERPRLAELLGREPSPEEMVDHHNRMVATSRSDPVRQGAVASLSDLAALQFVPTDPRVQSEMYAAEVEMDCPLTTAEVSVLVKRVVDRAGEVSERRRRVAERWLSATLEDEAVSASALSRELGIDRSTVGREVEAVRAIAKEVLVSSLGITPLTDGERKPPP